MNREKRQDRLDRALGRMIQATEEALDKAARQGKMHPTDLRCISLLSTSPVRLSPKDIITTLALTSGSGTALFDRLERLSYIRRIPNPEDRRSVIIELDRDASLVPLTLLQELRNRYREVTDRFHDHELDVISEYLEGVALLRPSADYD